jgi:magnesium transporter
MKEEIVLIQPETKIFLRDVLDHVNQVVNQIDVDREYLSDLVQTNMANMNSHLNSIIKVLTLISTIFIPLTFIVGVYGMNFDNFPEIHSQNGYYTVWGVMIAITLLQLLIFKKKKWL